MRATALDLVCSAYTMKAYGDQITFYNYGGDFLTARTPLKLYPCLRGGAQVYFVVHNSCLVQLILGRRRVRAVRVSIYNYCVYAQSNSLSAVSGF